MKVVSVNTGIRTLTHVQIVLDEFEAELASVIETAIDKGLPRGIMVTLLIGRTNQELVRVMEP